LAGHQGKIDIGLDCASSEFWVPEKQKYDLDFKGTPGQTLLSKKELLERYAGFCQNYNIVSIEDPFDQDDWEGWNMITETLGKKVQIVGDDLLVTNLKRIEMAVK
jgi:enolase